MMSFSCHWLISKCSWETQDNTICPFRCFFIIYFKKTEVAWQKSTGRIKVLLWGVLLTADVGYYDKHLVIWFHNSFSKVVIYTTASVLYCKNITKHLNFFAPTRFTNLSVGRWREEFLWGLSDIYHINWFGLQENSIMATVCSWV